MKDISHEIHVTNTESIFTLLALQRGALAAVETYDQALNSITGTTGVALTRNRVCHQKRALVQSKRITELGGIPGISSGAWGIYSRGIEGSAKVFGSHAALVALGKGEVQGLKDYNAAKGFVDSASQILIDSRLLPQQQLYQQVMGALIGTSHSGKIAGAAP